MQRDVEDINNTFKVIRFPRFSKATPKVAATRFCVGAKHKSARIVVLQEMKSKIKYSKYV